MKICKPFFSITFVFTFIFVNIGVFAETAPGDACSNNGSVMLSNANNESHHLICDGSNWNTLYNFNIMGKVGFHTPPSTSVSVTVNGEVKVGETTGLACNGTTEGAIRYNSTDKKIDICDGTSWTVVTDTCDTTPDGFSFTDIANRDPDSTATSGVIPITGITCGTDVSVTTTYGSQYRIALISTAQHKFSHGPLVQTKYPTINTFK